MLKKLIILGASVFAGACHPARATGGGPPSLPASIQAGVYDINHKFDKVNTLTYEAIWYSWKDYRGGDKLLPKLRAIAARARIPLLSIEPWPIKSIGEDKSLLTDIVSGKYDALITAVAKEMGAFNASVYLRWGPEMEFTHWYPWACQPAADYIAAFRRVVNLIKKQAPSTLILWSPVGNENCLPYYPGDDVVDVIGFSIYEVPLSSTSWFGHPMSFTDWMDNKYPRLSQFNKPIIIAEMGVSDSPENQRIWLANAFAAMPNYSLLKGFVYFNTRDLYSDSWKKWGSKTAPNWMVDPTLFTQKLKANQFPFQWTLEEWEQHFGKATAVEAGQYAFDSENYDMLISFQNGVVVRIRYHLKQGQFDEEKCVYLSKHTTPQTNWKSEISAADGLWHFSGRYSDEYAGVMSHNYTTLTFWRKTEAEVQSTK